MTILNSFDNIKIYYEFHKGNKNTLIFVHGWTHNHTDWSQEVDYFSKKNYSVISLDLRGHGMSDKPEDISAYKIENFAKDINQLIIKYKVKNPILIGHSLGGMILLKFEQLFPKIAKGLVLIDTTYKNPLKHMFLLKQYNVTPLFKQLSNYIMSNKILQNKYSKDVDFSKLNNHSDFFYWFKGVINTPTKPLLACFNEMIMFDESKLIDKINVSCLIIEGENDLVIPQKTAIYLYDHLKNSELHIIKNAGHNAPIQNQKKIIELIESFLNKI